MIERPVLILKPDHPNYPMKVTFFTRQTFHHDLSRAKRAAQHSPVLITCRGHLAQVLLSVERYPQIMKQPISLLDLQAIARASERHIGPSHLSRLSWSHR